MDRPGSVWIQLNGVPAIAPQNGSLASSYKGVKGLTNSVA